MRFNYSSFSGIIMVLCAGILWGVSGGVAQFLFEYKQFNAEWLVTVRLLSAGILLLLLSAVRMPRESFQVWSDRPYAGQLLVFSILGMLAVQYTYFAAIQHSNVATATVLQYTGPAFIIAYMALSLRRWPGVAQLLALLFTVAGTFLLVTHGRPGALHISFEALLWGFGAAVTLAFYTIQPTRLLEKYPSAVITGWGMTIGGIAFSVISKPWNLIGIWDRDSIEAILFIIIMGTLVPFYAYLTAIKKIGPQTAGLLICTEPLAAAWVGVAWLGVDFGAADWLGTVFIVTTVVLATLQAKTTGKSPGIT